MVHLNVICKCIFGTGILQKGSDVVREEKVGRNTAVEVDGTRNATKLCPTSEMKINYKYSMPLHAPVADSDKTHKVCSRSYPRSVWPCPV